MGRLLVVRHGQASAGSDDYDRLSRRGHEQSERLGRWLAACGTGIEHIVCGQMLRHRQTLESVLQGIGRDDLPQPEVDAGFNEFDHGAVLRCFVERFPDHPDASIAARIWDAEPRQITALIRAALGAWSRCELDTGVPEAWAAFRARVLASAARWAGDRGGDVLVITSGGVIAQLAQAALGAPDERAVELNLSIRNSAVCELVAARGGLQLLSWNTVPHLHDAPELWTFY